MFDVKKTSLLIKSDDKNSFVEAAKRELAKTTSGNGALKYNTSGNLFVDDFAYIANYLQPRKYADIAADMQKLWAIDRQKCVKMIVYTRMITRQPDLVSVDNSKIIKLETQRGAGLKHEGIMRMIWLGVNHSDLFKLNVMFFITAGSWKDIFVMLETDLIYHGWKNKKLDWKFMYHVILAGLSNPNTINLVLKYLPTIKNNRSCTTVEAQAKTIIGRWIARKLFPKEDKINSFSSYRRLKATGKAHQWQQLISKQLFEAIDFNTIAGRALSLIVNSKFLINHKLYQKCLDWIKEQPVAKYTGYVFELLGNLRNITAIENANILVTTTIDKQFATLLKEGTKGVNVNSTLLVVRDISLSMRSKAVGTKYTSDEIAKSLALYFSEFLKGPFANCYISFAREAIFVKFIGNTPSEKYINDQICDFGSTNFQSVITTLINVKNTGVEEKEFPTGLLVISDGEFDIYNTNTKTNFKIAINRLTEAGFSKEYVNNFKIILWDIPNAYYSSKIRPKFESFADYPNFFYLSGFDGSILSFLLGDDKTQKKTPKTAEELLEAALDQQLLNLLQYDESQIKDSTIPKNKKYQSLKNAIKKK